MTSTTLERLVRHLRQLDRPSDAELLERFHSGDRESFEAIVRRHGGGVLAACRKVLPSEADAEDAFQATFLILLRNGHAIRRHQALGGWLCGVAHRIALKALAGTVRRRLAEQRKPTPQADAPDLSWREACAILHEELDRLPDVYRLPLILCYLEGKSRDEAAQLLGWKTDVLRGRLERGRDRLRGRLTRRGVTLTAGLLGGLQDVANGGPLPRLIQATVEAVTAGRPSAAVAALANGGTPGMFTTKLKLVAALVILVGVVVGVAGSRPPATAEPPPEPKAQPAAQAPAKAADEQPLTVAGRVLRPDGEPIVGARLFVPRLKKVPPQSPDDYGVEQVGTSGAEGAFKVTFKPSFGRLRGYVIAHAPGFGVDWVELEAGKPTDPAPEGTSPVPGRVPEGATRTVVLKLVKDQPITGRLLDTEGKPAAGVTVGVTSIYVPENEKLDDYLAGWKKGWREVVATPVKRLYVPLAGIVGETTTDKNGQYKLSGAGVERIVHVSIHGGGVARMKPYVITRAGFDGKAYNEAALTQEPAQFRIKGQLPILYGPEATVVVEAGKVIEGVVKDISTGTGLPGVRVTALFGFGESAEAIVDANGKYRLEGVPQDKNYQVHATPPEGSPYIRRSASVAAEPGTGPVRIEVELAKGVIVSGRVIDRQTGKGVVSGVRFAPLPENKYFGKPGFDGYRSDHTMQGTDREGRFRVVTIPGKSLLMVQTHSRQKVDDLELCPYLTARPDPDYKDLFKYVKEDDMWLFTSASGGLEFLNIENVVKVVDLKEDDTEVKVELFVERGQTAKLVIHDPDGKPLPGVVVSGLTAHWPIAFQLRATETPVTVYALDPERPRRLVFMHPQKKLGGSVTVRGDEKEPVVVKLVPLGAVTGRFLEIEGTPLAGAEVSLNCPDRIASELYRYLGRSVPAVKTDKDGRFALPAVPGVKFSLQTRKGETFFVGEPRIGLREVEPGKTLDLGDWKLKPRR
jgi:RNA polymerase sigma factor (sigma-70 family)